MKRPGNVRSDKSRGPRLAVSTRDLLWFAGGVAIICVVLKCPSLLYPRTEGDERIYWQLAQTLGSTGDYSLRGTELLKELSSYVYDRPLFHHPPLFPALLAPFAIANMENAAVLVSWLGHVLAVLAVAIIARHILNQRSEDASITLPEFWLPVLGVSADPLLMFVSRRIWVDSLLSGLIALSVALLLTAGGRRRRATLVAAGSMLGLAALAKLTALILLPVFVFVCVRDEETWRERGISMAAAALPVAMLVVPWLILFYSRNGVFLPSWVKPDERLMQLYPFVRAAVERPWYYYVLKLAVVMPLALVVVWALMQEKALWTNRTVQVAVTWFGTVLVALTALGVNGYGFQMRHIAPAVTALYVILLVLLIDRERPLLLMVSSFAMVVGTATGAMYLLAPQFDEIVSLARVAGLSSY